MSRWSEVNLRLKEWAEWFSANPFGLGYPSKSREYHLWKGTTTFNHKPPQVMRHPRAEEIETCVNQLKAQVPILADVINEHYFYPSMPIKKHAVRLNISPATYCHYLEVAQAWVAGCLTVQPKP